MNDYYSNFPGPSEETIIKEFVESKTVGAGYPQWKKEICAKLAIAEMGGADKFGSAIGWVIFGKELFNKMALHYLEKQKLKFKTLSKLIILLNQMHSASVENIWAPGGSGFYQAYEDFKQLSLKE